MADSKIPQPSGGGGTGDSNPFADPTSRQAKNQQKMHEALIDVVQVGSAGLPIPPSKSYKSRSDAPPPPLPKGASNISRGPKPAKAARSKHRDIIDDMDFTTLGVHHAGPYDAVAPSRNVNNTKSPMAVFDSTTDSNSSPSKPGSSRAIAAARAATMAQQTTSGDNEANPTGAPINSSNLKPSSEVDSAPQSAVQRESGNPLLEIWGKHDHEPYQEFSMSAGVTSSRASSIWDDKAGEGVADVPDDEIINATALRPQQTNRTPSKKTIPTPAILGLPEFEHEVVPIPSPPLFGGQQNMPKRSLSIAQRIRRIRPTQNVSTSVPNTSIHESKINSDNHSKDSNPQSPPSPSKMEGGYPMSQPLDESALPGRSYFGSDRPVPQTPDKNPNDRTPNSSDREDNTPNSSAAEEKKSGGLFRKMSKLARGKA